MQAALYFPFINVPATPWWTTSLLYWDTVGTIVPESYREQPDLLGEYTLKLIREGLLRQVFPEEAGPRLAQTFDRYLHRLDRRELARRRESYERLHVTSIHPDKWLSYGSGLEYIVGEGLAARGRDEWITVEASTADEFMAALALALCEEASLFDAAHRVEKWVPITDRPQSVYALLAGLEPMFADEPRRRIRLRVQGELRTAEIRTALLADLLPVPFEAPAVDQLVRFRNRYGDLLPSLRRHLEDRIDDVMAIDDRALRVRKMDRISEEMQERVRQAEAYLSEAGFRRVSRSSLLRLIKFVPLVKDVVEAGQEMAADMTTNPGFQAEPLAYLAFARVAFNPAARYGSVRYGHAQALAEAVTDPLQPH